MRNSVLRRTDRQSTSARNELRFAAKNSYKNINTLTAVIAPILTYLHPDTLDHHNPQDDCFNVTRQFRRLFLDKKIFFRIIGTGVKVKRIGIRHPCLWDSE